MLQHIYYADPDPDPL